MIKRWTTLFMKWWQRKLDPDHMLGDRLVNEMRIAIAKKEIEAIIGPRRDDND